MIYIVAFVAGFIFFGWMLSKKKRDEYEGEVYILKADAECLECQKYPAVMTIDPAHKTDYEKMKGLFEELGIDFTETTGLNNWKGKKVLTAWAMAFCFEPWGTYVECDVDDDYIAKGDPCDL